jgi:transcriptional antiterminator RfaH
VALMWVAAQLLPRREALALHCLALAGYLTYLPRCRERRLVHGRRIEVTPPLFPGYCFVVIEQQWHSARWAPGVASIIMDGDAPAKVSDAVIDEIRSRERNGVVELPQPPSEFRLDQQVRIVHGALAGKLAIYSGMKSCERVEILLTMLGAQQRVILPRSDIARP